MTPKAIANGNPRCWHCLNRLTYKKGGGFRFALVVDPIGTEHRVHLHCVDDAIGDGVKAVLTLTPADHALAAEIAGIRKQPLEQQT